MPSYPITAPVGELEVYVRLLFGLLFLANLVVFLLTARLPGPDESAVPDANLPRVDRVQVLEETEGIAKPPENP